jgi:hypothetical protein
MARSIALSRGLFALVDDEDYDRVTAIGKWYADPSGKTFYARKNFWRDGSYTSIRMHALITGIDNVDHANGNGLDNQKSNLRPATGSQNCQNRGIRSDNSSGFKGVYWSRQRGKWVASIWFDGRERHLGVFTDPAAAAHAYDAAAHKAFGEFARPNFPEEIAP